MSTEIIISTAISALFTVLFMVIIGGNEKNIRSWISHKKTGWLRQLYVNIFIDVVRGRDKAYNVKYSHAVWLLIGGILASVMLLQYQYAKQNLDKAESLHIQLVQARNERDNKETREKQEEAGSEKKTTGQIKQELKSLLSDLNTQVRGESGAVQSAVDEMVSEAKLAKLVATFTLSFFSIYFLFLIIRHKTIIAFRATFSFELDRFINRIQYLASKKELAELVALEAKVNDEESAMRFVSHVETIATRHGVEDLVQVIRLWDKYPSAPNE